MNQIDYQEIYRVVKEIQRKIEIAKNSETHLEKNRLLKLIDAELMDALHNLESLIKITRK